MILLFTGNGKGKTTAALGQMMRALGRDKSALMIQFIKGPWRSGEDEFAARFSIPEEKLSVKKMGLGFVGILGDRLPREAHEKAAREALDHFKTEKESGKWHLIVLDEVNNAVDLNLITAKDVIEAIKDYPDEKILMLTGRGATQEMIDAADLVTEVREVKHPWNEGKWAKYTVEF
jgi:cob(I)alamin adenosyltransferase